MSVILIFSVRAPRTQQHLRNVYASLTLTSVAASLASYLYIQRLLPDAGWIISLPLFGSVLGITMLPQSMSSLRHLLLYLFGFANGWGIGPLLRHLLFVDPSVPMLALTGTAVIFLSFTLTALMTERRSQLYLGGFLGSAVSAMLIMGLLNSFIGSDSLFSAEIYLGLLVLSGYVVYDTQVMVELAEQNRFDVPRDSLNLFTNLFGIFVRLLIILARQNEERDRRRRRRSSPDK